MSQGRPFSRGRALRSAGETRSTHPCCPRPRFLSHSSPGRGSDRGVARAPGSSRLPLADPRCQRRPDSDPVASTHEGQFSRVVDTRPCRHKASYVLDRLTTSDGDPVDPDACGASPAPPSGCRPSGARLPCAASWTTPKRSASPPCRTNLVGRGGAAGGVDERRGDGERRTLIAGTRKWDAGTAVRAEWLTAFLASTTLPRNATVCSLRR